VRKERDVENSISRLCRFHGVGRCLLWYTYLIRLRGGPRPAADGARSSSARCGVNPEPTLETDLFCRVGDVVLEVTSAPHAVFRREGSDLHTQLTITLKQSLLGRNLFVDGI